MQKPLSNKQIEELVHRATLGCAATDNATMHNGMLAVEELAAAARQSQAQRAEGVREALCGMMDRLGFDSAALFRDTSVSNEQLADSLFQSVREEEERCVKGAVERIGLEHAAQLQQVQRSLDEALEWIRVVSEELVTAGGKPGDRTVALSNLREVLAAAPRPEPSCDCHKKQIACIHVARRIIEERKRWAGAMPGGAELAALGQAAVIAAVDSDNGMSVIWDVSEKKEQVLEAARAAGRCELWPRWYEPNSVEGFLSRVLKAAFAQDHFLSGTWDTMPLPSAFERTSSAVRHLLRAYEQVRSVPIPLPCRVVGAPQKASPPEPSALLLFGDFCVVLPYTYFHHLFTHRGWGDKEAIGLSARWDMFMRQVAEVLLNKLGAAPRPQFGEAP